MNKNKLLLGLVNYTNIANFVLKTTLLFNMTYISMYKVLYLNAIIVIVSWFNRG